MWLKKTCQVEIANSNSKWNSNSIKIYGMIILFLYNILFNEFIRLS